MSRYPFVPLGQVLALDVDEARVIGTEEYPIAGVYGFGRGIFERSMITGDETRYQTLQRMHANQLIVSRLKAFEGAIAVVPTKFEGYFVSKEFPTFTITGSADPAYLAHICRWPALWTRLRETSKGVGARRERVHEEALLTIEIPLPDLDEQRRIAERLDGLHRLLGELDTAAMKEPALEASVLVQCRQSELSRVAGVQETLENVADVEMGQSPPGYSYNEAGQGLPLLNGPTEFGDEYPAPVQWTSAPTKICQPSDLLFSVRASIGRMNWADRQYCIGRGVSAIHPRRDIVLPRFLRHVLAWRAINVRQLSAGSTFLNLPGGKLRQLEIPTPPLALQRAIAGRLDAVETRTAASLKLLQRRAQIRTALEPAILNRAFSGEG